jgi:hypothetical protein
LDRCEYGNLEDHTVDWGALTDGARRAVASLFLGHGMAAESYDGRSGDVGVVDWETETLISRTGGVGIFDLPVLHHTKEFCEQGRERAAS